MEYPFSSTRIGQKTSPGNRQNLKFGEHEYKYSALPITAGFAGIPRPSATFLCPSEGHDSAVVSAGVSAQLTSAISTYVNYDGQLGRGNYDSNAVTAIGLVRPIVRSAPGSRSIRTSSVRHTHANGFVISGHYLCVPFAKEFEQPSGVVQCVNGVPLTRRSKSIFKPVGNTWVCKDLFESHTYLIAASATLSESDAQESNPKGYHSTAPVPHWLFCFSNVMRHGVIVALSAPRSSLEKPRSTVLAFVIN
jgi:hypothetical protein